MTALDDPRRIVASSEQTATRPVISSLGVDPVVEHNGWDVACWVDALTVIPDGAPQHACEFYAKFEA